MKVEKINKERLKKNEEIIFKWDREMLENMLESVFEKVGR